MTSETALSAETLCVTLLLVHYEKFVRIGDSTWSKHVAAVGRLMQMRGACRHRSGLGYLMYLASRGLLVRLLCYINPCLRLNGW
jgi:hypothetical protein